MVRTTRVTSHRRQINKSNVSQLQVAWTYPFGDTSFGPIVSRRDLRPRTKRIAGCRRCKDGKELWIPRKHERHDQPRHELLESADGRDQRLIFAMNSMLQELDAKTGKSIMTFGTNGYVDLRIGIDGRDPSTIGNIQSNTPGEIFENLLILGSATGEGYFSPPGDIRAYDVRDGKLAWTFHTVPRPGEFGYETWPKDAWKYSRRQQQLGRDDHRYAARHRVHPARIALHTISTASIASARICSAHRSWRWMREPENASGTFQLGASRFVGHGSERGAAADNNPVQRTQS
jgi:hypothetical protein